MPTGLFPFYHWNMWRNVDRRWNSDMWRLLVGLGCVICISFIQPVFTISLVLDEGERSYRSYKSYIFFQCNAQVLSKRSHSTIYNCAGYFPT